MGVKTKMKIRVLYLLCLGMYPYGTRSCSEGGEMSSLAEEEIGDIMNRILRDGILSESQRYQQPYAVYMFRAGDEIWGAS